MLRQVKASHQWWVCNKSHHPAISPEQDASKIVKISQQMAKLCRKLQWLVFFWDTVYRAVWCDVLHYRNSSMLLVVFGPFTLVTERGDEASAASFADLQVGTLSLCLSVCLSVCVFVCVSLSPFCGWFCVVCCCFYGSLLTQMFAFIMSSHCCLGVH